ncbi:MAG: hypothetical protein QNJ06_01485 [Kiloniellales bacterium]|nr:hypothetical protein [Kiloniellales bacterium]MDJ0968542.1 hypothetical protein [Kiloniellales bacterium]
MGRLRYGFGIAVSICFTVAGYGLALTGGGILAVMGFYGELFGAEVTFGGGVPIVEHDPVVTLLSWFLGFGMLGMGTLTMSHALRSLFIRLETGRVEAGPLSDVEDAETEVLIRQLAKKLSRSRQESRRPA